MTMIAAVSSSWVRWVGLRYLRAKKSTKFINFITLLSILGIAVGVAAMVIVLSVMDGFETELKKRLISADLHIQALPPRGQSMVDDAFFDEEGRARAIRADSNLEAIFPILGAEAIVRAGKRITGAVVKGISSDRIKRLDAQVTERIEDGYDPSKPPLGLFMGQEMAAELGVRPGDEVSLVSPTETEGLAGTIPRVRQLRVLGIYRSGLPDQELHTIFASMATLRSFLRKSGVLTSFEITVRDFDRADDSARRLREILPTARIEDWRQLNAHLFASLRLERISMFVILAFIVIVASFNIVTTLTLMVLEKRREISIMKAMGARDKEIGAIFVTEGLLIGVVGTMAGAIIASGVCWALDRYRFIELPDVYYDQTLPVTFNVLYYALPALSSVLIVLVACWYPARRAAKLHPLEGIRYG